MAAPIFKFRNIRVPLTTVGQTLVYAVDTGLGENGLEVGVLPGEVSTVMLTVQCSNKRSPVPPKTVTATIEADDYLTVSSTADLYPGLPVTFSGTALSNIVLGQRYYVKQVVNGTTFTISDTLTNGDPGTVFNINADDTGSMTATFDTQVRINAIIKDLTSLTDAFLVSNYGVLPNNAFDPLSGNLVLTNKLALYVQADAKNAMDVTVSLLEIANATAT
jgi:hypothetical protein